MLFDLDGTLADSEAQIAAAMVATLAAFGHEVTAEQAIAMLGPPLLPMFERLAGRRFTDDEARAMLGEYVRHYDATLQQVSPLPGAVELLDALAAAGIPLAIVSNKREQGAHAQLASLGWTDRFAAVIGADTAQAAKPAPEPAIEALRRLDARPGEAAFVGDTETDMACARSATVAVRIGLTRARPAAVLLAAGATAVCADLAGVGRMLRPIEAARLP